MSALINTKKALERRLVQNFPNIKIAFENINFNKPSEMYFEVQLVVLQPEDVVVGSKYYRERFSFQIFVVDLPNKGVFDAIDVAEQIRTIFDKGMFLQESDSRIHVLRTPRIESPEIVEQHLVVPVIIPVITEVYKD